MNPLCFINSEFLAYQEISLHISDISIQRAYAIFDFMAQRGDEIPFIDSYLNRFKNSAAIMHLELPHSIEKITGIIIHLV